MAQNFDIIETSHVQIFFLLHCFLAGEGKFAIQNIIAAGRHIGRIVTTKTGHGQYEKGREFSLVVSAQDTSVPPTVIQKSNFEIVKVLVGSRPPQFFEDPYIGYVMENNQAGYKYVNLFHFCLYKTHSTMKA